MLLSAVDKTDSTVFNEFNTHICSCLISSGSHYQSSAHTAIAVHFKPDFTLREEGSALDNVFRNL